MLSLCTTFWQVILAQGFVIGIGGGCLYIPSVAILPTYFSSRIGLALGIGASGSSMGGIIYPIMFFKLIDQVSAFICWQFAVVREKTILTPVQVGFGWSVRILGFMTLVTLLIPIFLMKMRIKPAKVRSVIDWSAFTDAPFVSSRCGTMFCSR